MDFKITKKDALTHVKERKFIYFIAIFLLIVFWAIIGLKVVEVPNKYVLNVFLSNSKLDVTNNNDLLVELHDCSKEVGYKRFTVQENSLSSSDEKTAFSLSAESIDLFIVSESVLKSYAENEFFNDLRSYDFLDLTQFKVYNHVYYNQTEQVPIAIQLSDDYYFAVGFGGEFFDGALQKIFEVAKKYKMHSEDDTLRIFTNLDSDTPADFYKHLRDNATTLGYLDVSIMLNTMDDNAKKDYFKKYVDEIEVYLCTKNFIDTYFMTGKEYASKVKSLSSWGVDLSSIDQTYTYGDIALEIDGYYYLLISNVEELKVDTLTNILNLVKSYQNPQV